MRLHFSPQDRYKLAHYLFLLRSLADSYAAGSSFSFSKTATLARVHLSSLHIRITLSWDFSHLAVRSFTSPNAKVWTLLCRSSIVCIYRTRSVHTQDVSSRFTCAPIADTHAGSLLHFMHLGFTLSLRSLQTPLFRVSGLASYSLFPAVGHLFTAAHAATVQGLTILSHGHISPASSRTSPLSRHKFCLISFFWTSGLFLYCRFSHSYPRSYSRSVWFAGFRWTSPSFVLDAFSLITAFSFRTFGQNAAYAYS